MAMCDYRWCNVCGCKAFYDANLHYEDDAPLAQNEQELPAGPVADMACLCGECLKTHKIAIVPRTSALSDEVATDE